jgi:tRNA(Ile)-lysidine synthetase-like protein
MVSVKLPKGKYVLAVSGGVDSMVLLDILRRQKDVELVVAHADHGIRSDSKEDKKLIHHYTTSHNIKLVSKRLNLGEGTSEEKARDARYGFLRHCRTRFKADYIVTAQHQDDLLETAVINLLRGTGWRGLAPFVMTNDVLRPLADYKKSQLLAYAKANNLQWREDSTNSDQNYLRNYVRLSLLPRLVKDDKQFKSKLLRLIRKQQLLRRKIENQLDELVAHGSNSTCDRHALIMAPPEVAYEFLQHICKRATGASLTSPLATSALLFAKTAKPGKTMPLSADWQVRVTVRQLIVEPRPVMLS